MNTKNSSIVCPVGEPTCHFLDEVVVLRQKNRELSKLARTDTLTGIFNFRVFMQSLELEMERTRRSAQPTTLIMIDLDHFKNINDTWGHEAGNIALTQTAESLRQAIRKLDIPCRYGGEEFAIILPSTNLLIGIQVAERIRKIIETTPLMSADQEIKITASLGVDAFLPSQSDTSESFVKRADHHLYRAKEAGRNRVCHAIQEEALGDSSVSQEERDSLFKMFDN